MCTVHSFPHNIDHCLTFARSEFEGMFEKAPTEANAYLADPEKYVATVRASSDAAARDQLEKVVAVLADERCNTFQDCISWARHIFQVCSSSTLPPSTPFPNLKELGKLSGFSSRGARTSFD